MDFLVAGIHVVPDHDKGVPLTFHIGHSREDPFFNAPFRRDLELPGIPEFYQGRFRTFPALEGLCEYIVQRFQEGSFGEWEARVLCEVLLAEFRRSFARRVSADPLPPLLEKLTDRMREDLCADYSLPALAVELKTSISGVIRLFRKHLAATPGRYLTLERMAAAERLLVTTGLPVRTVGERVGVGDEFYFSKLFKKEKGISALAFRKKHSL
ncbi:MAG: AraC family transcriptional regulator [Fibrobacterota bacterium]